MQAKERVLGMLKYEVGGGGGMFTNQGSLGEALWPAGPGALGGAPSGSRHRRGG